MKREEYISKISHQQTEPTEWDYLITSCQIAQVDNGVETDKISTSGGGYKEGTVINESFFNDNISSPNKPSWSHVSKIIAELKSAYSDANYARKRQVAYPDLAEQFDILYHSGIDGLKSELKKTKDKFPKSE